MQITLVQGLLIALLVFICAIDKHMETFMWFRPLVVAFFTGIILGDVRSACRQVPLRSFPTWVC